MSSIPTFALRATDGTGTPINGAKLYTYETGTTTPLATYSDEALTTPNTNPVVANSGGYFGAIYLDKTKAYRLKLTDASDLQIVQRDNVRAVMLTSSSLETRFKQAASNPLDYGAIGDGAADESTEVQAAIDAATGVVDLLGKTYRCDSTVTAKDGLTIRNGTLLFTGTAGLSIAGSFSDPASTSMAVGVATLSAAITGLSDGDWIKVRDGADTKSEWFEVDNPATASVSRAATETCSAASTVRKLIPMTGVMLENVTLIGASAAALQISGGNDIQIIDCNFLAAFADIDDSVNVTFDGCRFFAGGYLTTGGAVSNVRLVNCDVLNDPTDGGGAAAVSIGVSGTAHDVLVENCRFVCTDLIVTGAHRFKMRGGGIWGATAAAACRLDFTGNDGVISDCEIDAIKAHIDLSDALQDCGLAIDKVQCAGITIGSHAPTAANEIVYARITNCKLRGSATSGGTAYSGITATEMTNLQVRGCEINNDSAGIAATMNGSDKTNKSSAVITGNIITTHGAGITISNAVRFEVTGNSISSHAGSTLDLGATAGKVTTGVVTGNVLQGVDTSPNVNVSAADASGALGINVAGNTLKDGTYGINASNVASSLADGNIYLSMATGRINGSGFAENHYVAA